MKKSSLDGSTPISEHVESTLIPEPTPELVSRTKRVIEHPDPDQLDPEMFRVDESEQDQVVAKTVLTAIGIRRPSRLEFIRTHPSPDYRLVPVYFITLQESREYYLVDPKLKVHLRPREYSKGALFLATNRYDRPFFWLVTTQSSTGRISDWYTSALECEERARYEWVQVVADQNAGVYTVGVAEEPLPEPEWPEQSFQELFQIGFKRRWVNSLDHSVFKELRGRA
jgi:hypothetical protein